MVKYFNITYFLSESEFNKVCFTPENLLYFDDENASILKVSTNKNYIPIFNGYRNVINDNYYNQEKFLLAPFIELVYYVLNHSIIKNEENKFYLDFQKADKILFEYENEKFILTKVISDTFNCNAYYIFDFEYINNENTIKKRFILPSIYYYPNSNHDIVITPLLGDYINMFIYNIDLL